MSGAVGAHVDEQMHAVGAARREGGGQSQLEGDAGRGVSRLDEVEPDGRLGGSGVGEGERQAKASVVLSETRAADIDGREALIARQRRAAIEGAASVGDIVCRIGDDLAPACAAGWVMTDHGCRALEAGLDPVELVQCSLPKLDLAGAVGQELCV